MSKIKKHNIILSTIIAIFIIMAMVLIIKWPIIFQKGNPIPYVKSILELNKTQTYMQVKDDNQITFITKRDNYKELHEYIEGEYDVTFDEQMGSGFIFSSDEKVVTVISEIYWKYYMVWTVSIK